MIIGSKSILLESQLRDRKSKGVSFIELHSTLEDLKDIKATINKKHVLRQIGITVYAIHSPILNSYQKECVIGESNTRLRKDNMNLLKKSIILADKLSDHSNPVVIVRMGGLMEEMERTTLFLKERKELLQRDLLELRNYIVEHYPKVTIVVKNNPKLINTEKGVCHYGYGFEGDFILWIKELRDEKVRVCLDIANAIGTIRYNQQYNPNSLFTSMEAYMYRYAPYLKLIHLSNGREWVSKEEEYGLPFLPTKVEDKVTIREILSLTKQLNYTLPVTIVTNESDENDAVNYLKTRETIIESLKR